MKKEIIALIIFSVALSGFGAINNISSSEPVIGLLVTPTPTPTPDLPFPEPPINMAANTDQISAFTGEVPSPWGGVFDPEGRYIFFDLKVWINDTTYHGTNQLIRMTGEGSSASFEVLATQAQLAAVDSRWGDEYLLELGGLDILFDGSIVMIGYGENPQKLLRIVPVNPPQITVIASFDFETITPWVASKAIPGQFVEDIAVDRAQNPNRIYFLMGRDIYSVYSNQTNATPALWLDTGQTLYNIYDLVVDNNGDIIYCENMYGGNIKKVEKTTKAITTISQSSLNDTLKGNYSSVLALDINRKTGDLFGLYYSYPPYPYTWSSYNLFKATKSVSGLYTGTDFALEQQVLEDPDIFPWWGVWESFLIRGGGLAVHPQGRYFFCTSGSNNEFYGALVRHGIDCIVKIGTEALLGASPAHWRRYE